MQTQRSILISGCMLSALFALGFNLMPATLASAASMLNKLAYWPCQPWAVWSSAAA